MFQGLHKGFKGLLRFGLLGYYGFSFCALVGATMDLEVNLGMMETCVSVFRFYELQHLVGENLF